MAVGSTVISNSGDDQGVKYQITVAVNGSDAGKVVVCGNNGNVGKNGVVTIPPTITINEESYTVTKIEANAFKDYKALTSIEYPAGITVGDGAFKGTSATCAAHRFDKETKNGVCEVCDYKCEHTDKSAATCVASAVCNTCGSNFGDVDRNAHAWNWAYSNGKHDGVCTLNNSHVKLGNCAPGEDGNCTDCGTKLVASVEDWQATTYYATANEAFEAAMKAGNCTVTILADTYLNKTPTVGNNQQPGVSLVVNPGAELKIVFVNLHLSDISGGGAIEVYGADLYAHGTVSNVTITGSGAYLHVYGTVGDVTINYCTIYNYGTIESGTFNYSVSNNGDITGGTFNDTVSHDSGTIRNGEFNNVVTTFDRSNDAVETSIVGGTFNNKLVHGMNRIQGGTINADSLILGENFSFVCECDGSGITCNHVHTERNTPATCVKGEICIFCGEVIGEPDPNAHSLTYYTSAIDTITERCIISGCEHVETATLETPSTHFPYNGAEQKKAWVTYSDGWLGGTLEIQYPEGCTDAGIVKVSIEATNGVEADGEYTIIGIEPTAAHFIFTPPEDLTYNGKTKAATVALASPYDKAGDITVKYYQNGKELNESLINAGTYTVKIDVAGGTNFMAAQNITDENWTFTIAKAESVKTAPTPKQNLVYNGQPQELTTAAVPNGNHDVRYWFPEEGYSEEILTAKDAGTYTVKWYVGQDNDNYKLSLGEITVTIAPATITVTPKAGQTMTYGDTVPALDYTSSGHIGTEIPAFEGALGSSGTDAGTHEITQGTLKLVDNGNFMANNYKIQVASENVIIRKKDLLVTAQDQSIVYGQKLDQTKYIIGELVEGDTAIVTLTPSTTKVTTAGVVEPSVLICNASGENVTENYAVTLGAGKLVIKPDTSKIDDLTTDNVTSADVENIKAVQDMLKNADSVKEEWKSIGEKCEALLEKIKAVQDAADTDTIQNAEGVTAENVKLDDKKALEDAVTDLKQVLEDNGGNYTEQEKKAIEDEIQRIEDAMGALENVEDVTETITQLPETVEPDDEAAVEKILDAKEAYDALTDHEKSLVEESAKKKLDDLVAALTDYAIIKGDSGKWTKGSNYGLSFTANGPLSKFVGIEVDGKKVDEKHYEVKSGSTIITMKRSYLKNLSAGKHTIKVLYTDGETSGTFHIQEPSTIPETGDDSNIMLYGSMFTISLAAIVVLLLNSKKRKQGNA